VVVALRVPDVPQIVAEHEPNEQGGGGGGASQQTSRVHVAVRSREAGSTAAVMSYEHAGLFDFGV
jgi:hypothetical protein